METNRAYRVCNCRPPVMALLATEPESTLPRVAAVARSATVTGTQLELEYSKVDTRVEACCNGAAA